MEKKDNSITRYSFFVIIRQRWIYDFAKTGTNTFLMIKNRYNLWRIFAHKVPHAHGRS
jgi:hypothetical protein